MNQFLNAIVILFISIWVGCKQEPTGGNESTTKDTIISASQYMPDSIPLTYLLGRFEPSEDTNFVQIANQYAKGSAIGTYLQRETYQAFISLHEAAAKDGIAIHIISATRNFERQKGIWEAKWNGNRLVEGMNLSQEVIDPQQRALKILRYSSMPGTSRHHWGTDIDINSFSNEYFEQGEGKDVYVWMIQHAKDFGFCQPYTDKSINLRTGYEEEKWHWSYMPLAKNYTKAYEAYVSPTDIKGFDGSELADTLNVIQLYVLGISPKCMID